LALLLAVHPAGVVTEMRSASKLGPPFVANSRPFDPTRLLSLVFDVPSTSSGANSFAFCISHLVTQVRFNVSNPPPTGILPQLVELTSADCTTAPDCQAEFGGPPALTTAGSTTVALGDLVTADAQHANKVSDPTISTGLQFVVSPLPGKAFDYNFCIQDLQFLDAAGNEVSR
jgi:hypothetical protein